MAGRGPGRLAADRARYVCDIGTGEKDTADAVPDGEYPFFVRSPNVEAIDTYGYDCEAVLTAGDGDVGKIFHHYVGKFEAHQRVYLFTRFRGVTGRYLYYYFSNFFRNVTMAGTAESTVDSLRRPMLTSFPVLTPPHEVQRKITDFLDTRTSEIDLLIERQQDLASLLLERRVALVDRVISASADGTGKRLRYVYRPSGDARRPEAEVLSVYRDYGVVPKASRTDNHNRTPEKLDHYLFVRPGDLVVNKMKAWQGSLGVSAHEGIVSPDYEVLRQVDHSFLPEYLHYALRSPRMISQYRARSVGIRPSQWRIYWDQLGDIRIAPLPVEEQRAIVREVEGETSQIDALIDKTKAMSAVLEERRAALVAAAVTGRLHNVRDRDEGAA